MNETKLNGETLDIAEENIQKLKNIFPDVFIEGKVDFEKLQQILGEYIETESERYNFSWNGKAKALRLAQTPSTGTLRPCKEESKGWDTTQNLYIEGDNLEVLKLLQKSYHGKVKMIYIDPPYNTGKDFVYPDNFTDSIGNYKDITGQVDSEGNNISSNAETSGRYHTDWLNMMYPRLRLARNLLTDDGVIFISIDDKEIRNLRNVCDEIFGEDNFIGTLLWKKKTNGNNMGIIPSVHDYIIVYAKSKTNVSEIGYEITEEFIEKNYSNPDNDIRGPWTTMDLSANHKGPYFLIKNPKTGEEYFPPEGRYWVFNEIEVLSRIESGRIIFGKSGTARPVQKVFAMERNKGKKRAESWWDNHGMNEDATVEMKEIFQVPKIFTHPKPSKLIYNLAKIATDRSDIILDFFSGSSTTAHAIMQLNAEDNGNRKFIMVQLPEVTDETDEAFQAGYKNICEIGKERIRRSGDKIKSEAGLTASNLEVGFKVFKLDSSNIKKWQPNYDDLENSLLDHINNYIDERSELDVVYEIILKCGLDLTYPIDEYTFADQNVYSIGFGALMICLDDNITTTVADGMVKLKNDLQPETWKVVFKDNGFQNDSNKTNIKEILKCGGLDDDAFTTL